MSESSQTPEQLRRENESLKARLHLLEEAIESMHHGFCVIDADGRIAACSSRYAEVLGLPPEKVQPGIDAERLVELGIEAGVYPPGTSLEEQAAAMWANLNCSDEEREPLRRGDRILASYPRRTPSGNMVATLQDVTFSAETEAALRASEARLSAILDAIPDSVKIYAEDGTLTYINPQGLEQLQHAQPVRNARRRLVALVERAE